MSFKHWCKMVEVDDFVIQDLMDDVANDSTFPEVKSAEDVIAYIASRGGCDEAKVAAAGAWFKYDEWRLTTTH